MLNFNKRIEWSVVNINSVYRVHWPDYFITRDIAMVKEENNSRKLLLFTMSCTLRFIKVPLSVNLPLDLPR